MATMIYAAQVRDLLTDQAREVITTLMEIPHFHYYPQLSDIWCLFDDGKFVAWMWLVPAEGRFHNIRMIDTLIRGKGYAERLMTEVSVDNQAWDLRPVDIVPSAVDYWKKLGYEVN